jgi:hypothetical protein
MALRFSQFAAAGLAQQCTQRVREARARSLASFYDRSFLEYAKKTPPPVRFEGLFNADMAKRSIADVVENARVLRYTLLIRLARRIVAIHQMPYAVGVLDPIQVSERACTGLCPCEWRWMCGEYLFNRTAANPHRHVQKLHDLFADTFHAFLRAPEAKTDVDEARFAALLQELLSAWRCMRAWMCVCVCVCVCV